MDTSYQNHDEGHMTIGLTLTPDELAALGPDSATIPAQTALMLKTLVALRTGALDADTAYWALNDLAKLARAIDGVTDAVIRQWPGSHGNLALALDIPRSTAQSRRAAIADRPASPSEAWAPDNQPTQ